MLLLLAVEFDDDGVSIAIDTSKVGAADDCGKKWPCARIDKYPEKWEEKTNIERAPLSDVTALESLRFAAAADIESETGVCGNRNAANCADSKQIYKQHKRDNTGMSNAIKRGQVTGGTNRCQSLTVHTQRTEKPNRVIIVRSSSRRTGQCKNIGNFDFDAR
jgi:hypothetical protein